MDQDGLYNECLLAMKQALRESTINDNTVKFLEGTRERALSETWREQQQDNVGEALENTSRGSIIASMVPDEIIMMHSDYSVRRYDTALMFIDVSGFSDLCEKFTKADRGSPSRLSQVLNAYIGAMVQDILTHGGDVLNFSGDAILSMWKRQANISLQCVVHSAIDCGLSIQKNFGTYNTDVGVVLRVRVVISAGIAHFALIGDSSHSHYVIVGQPVWDVKIAEHVAGPGDVLVSASAWNNANAAEYTSEPIGDGKHTRVLRSGITWKRYSDIMFPDRLPLPFGDFSGELENYYNKFSLRPVIISALRSSWWLTLRKFMVKTVTWAVENDEPMEFLTEIRRVVIVFVNVIVKTVTDELLVDIVNTSFKYVYSISSATGGLLNKVSMFDKDLMFLLVFGLRGMTDEDEALKSLLCAQKIKERLVDPNITSVSIGITSGTTYCGVVGHFLRREYTVIGTAVNKAARLMTAYPNKVTCDKETFLRSKLDQDFFRPMEFKKMKGIKKPGVVYEFNKYGWPEKPASRRQHLLDRNEELRTFILTLQRAMEQQHQPASSNQPPVYGVVFRGPSSIGKKRLVEECIYLTPNCVRVVRIYLTKADKDVPYGFFRKVAVKALTGSSSERNKFEYKILTRSTAIEIDIGISKLQQCYTGCPWNLDTDDLTPLQLYAINIIFGCRLALPEDFTFSGDILEENSIKTLVRNIFETNIRSLCLVAVVQATNIDDESWRLLRILLETKVFFLVMTVTDEADITDVARPCYSSNMLLKMTLSGLKPQYHAIISCQYLDVQAIPADLEKLIQCASGGMPGWIQNLIIALVQQGDLIVETVTWSRALKEGVVIPRPSLIFGTVDFASNSQVSLDAYFKEVLLRLDAVDDPHDGQKNAFQENELIQIAILSDTFDVLNVPMSMAADAQILKTYDSLAPFEKMLLKCSSVLGVTFPRDMLEFVLDSDSPKKIAEAVATLFRVRVLECEGGDFTQEYSKVMIHRALVVEGKPQPYCSCLGTKILPNCQDLPKYAFCGFMRFKSPLFRTNTYELLTETQKRDMHQRALLYLEQYTRRCWYCDEGCFHKLMGRRTNDGLVKESPELKKTQQMMRDFAEEKWHVAGDLVHSRSRSITEFVFQSSLKLPWLSCKLRGEHEKLLEAYLEYADLCVMNLNTPQALRLLNEAETLILTDEYWSRANSKINWFQDFCLGRVLSLRGGCMLKSGELIEARKHLHRALELFHDPYPTTKFRQMIHNMKLSVRQWMVLRVCPRSFVGKDRGLAGLFYEEVAVTLNRLYKLFIECNEYLDAELTAKWSLDYALRSNANFQLLCECYGNMITTYLNHREFAKCVALEKLAMDVCRLKRGLLDDAEARAVCILYTSVFLYYVENGKKNESLEFGVPIMYIMSKLPKPTMRVRLIVTVLRLLLSDLRLNEMVLLMRENLYITGQFDLSSTIWYYTNSMMILIETGYTVESYQECERFYMKHGDTILKSISKDATWDYFGCLWLITVRLDAWERALFWEEKVKEMISTKNKQMEFNLYLQLILLEGMLITLVREIDAMNMNRVAVLKETVKNMFDTVIRCCRRAPLYHPRYFFLLAYFNFIKGKKSRAHNNLKKTFELAKELAEGTILIWAEHTRQHWTGTLDPDFEDYWAEHVELHNLLDYRVFEGTEVIIPFTLPLPKNVL